MLQLKAIDSIIYQTSKAQRYSIYRYNLSFSIFKQLQYYKVTTTILVYLFIVGAFNPSTLKPSTSTCLLEAYTDFVDVFNIEAASISITNPTLEYYIKLKSNVQLPQRPIYQLSAQELETLYTYFKDTKQKGQIYTFTSLTSASIIFIPKKKGKLHLYIDYYILNQIIYKDYTVLLLILEILDYLSIIKHFTKINLKDITWFIIVSAISSSRLLPTYIATSQTFHTTTPPQHHVCTNLRR